MARVESVRASAFTIPTDALESDGTLEWDATTIVVVEVEAGDATGLGYAYTDRAAATLVEDRLAELVEGVDALDVDRAWRAMVAAVRNVGRAGIAASAISAVDAALWDLKSRLLGVPLVSLLGAVRDSIPVYGSGGFTSYSTDELCEQLAGWVRGGISAVKMKVGRRSAEDPARVRAARRAIGDEPTLMVDANGAYDKRVALERAREFADSAVTWFEEPVSSDDLEGLAFVRARSPAALEVAAGEYGWNEIDFRRMLEAGAVDVLQADATRCLGITGLLAAGRLCDAFGVPLSAHTAPSLHAHPACAIRRMRHVEYFHDHVRIESMLFDGAARAERGHLVPDRSRRGVGLELKRREAERWAA